MSCRSNDFANAMLHGWYSYIVTSTIYVTFDIIWLLPTAWRHQLRHAHALGSGSGLQGLFFPRASFLGLNHVSVFSCLYLVLLLVCLSMVCVCVCVCVSLLVVLHFRGPVCRASMYYVFIYVLSSSWPLSFIHSFIHTPTRQCLMGVLPVHFLLLHTVHDKHLSLQLVCSMSVVIAMSSIVIIIVIINTVIVNRQLLLQEFCLSHPGGSGFQPVPWAFWLWRSWGRFPQSHHAGTDFAIRPDSLRQWPAPPARPPACPALAF